MPTIRIMVRQRRAKSPINHIVCGNNDYTAHFDFDEEWAAYSMKTARFLWNGQYADVVFSGDTCTVPRIDNAQLCAVGVFAGDLRTSTPAFIKCEKSILCGDGSPAEPSPDVYAQLMEGFNSGKFGGYYTPEVLQLDEEKVLLTLTPSGEGLPAVPPVEIDLPRGPQGEPGPQGETGPAGAAGGYYIPELLPLDEETVVFHFEPSDASMPAIQDLQMDLPVGPEGPGGLRGADGARGPQGDPGEDGYTPQKGTDYWTDADKAEMVADVLAALPAAEGSTF